jgi:hypothetical protein
MSFLEAIALRPAYRLVRLTFGFRYHFIVFAVGDIDRVFAILLRLVHLVKRCLHLTGRVNIFELHLIHANAELVPLG